jgi:hypothetical protein
VLLLVRPLHWHWWLILQVSQQLLILLPAGSSSSSSSSCLLLGGHLGARDGGGDDTGAAIDAVMGALGQLSCLHRLACLLAFPSCWGCSHEREQQAGCFARRRSGSSISQAEGCIVSGNIEIALAPTCKQASVVQRLCSFGAAHSLLMNPLMHLMCIRPPCLLLFCLRQNYTLHLAWQLNCMLHVFIIVFDQLLHLHNSEDNSTHMFYAPA